MWRFFVGFVVADVSKGHSFYIIRVKHFKNGGAKRLKTCVFKVVPFFEKTWNHITDKPSWHHWIIQHFVIPLWEPVLNTYFLTQSQASLLRFVIYSHNPSKSWSTRRSSTYKLSLFLNYSITHLFTLFLCHSHFASPSTHPSLTHTDSSCPLTSTLSLSVAHSLFHSHVLSTC